MDFGKQIRHLIETLLKVTKCANNAMWGVCVCVCVCVFVCVSHPVISDSLRSHEL